MSAITRRTALSRLALLATGAAAAFAIPGEVLAAESEFVPSPALLRAIEETPFDIEFESAPEHLDAVFDLARRTMMMHSEGWDFFGDDWPTRSQHAARGLYEMSVDLDAAYGEEVGRRILRDGMRVWLHSGKVARIAEDYRS